MSPRLWPPEGLLHSVFKTLGDPGCVCPSCTPSHLPWTPATQTCSQWPARPRAAPFQSAQAPALRLACPFPCPLQHLCFTLRETAVAALWSALSAEPRLLRAARKPLALAFAGWWAEVSRHWLGSTKDISSQFCVSDIGWVACNQPRGQYLHHEVGKGCKSRIPCSSESLRGPCPFPRPTARGSQVRRTPGYVCGLPARAPALGFPPGSGPNQQEGGQGTAWCRDA